MKGAVPLIKGVSFAALLADRAFYPNWLLEELSNRGATAVTTSTMGQCLPIVFAERSELEHNLVNERAEDGRTSAKKRSVKFGRKFKRTTHQQDQVRTMLREGQSIRAIARRFSVGVVSIDRTKKTTQLNKKILPYYLNSCVMGRVGRILFFIEWLLDTAMQRRARNL